MPLLLRLLLRLLLLRRLLLLLRLLPLLCLHRAARVVGRGDEREHALLDRLAVAVGDRPEAQVAQEGGRGALLGTGAAALLRLEPDELRPRDAQVAEERSSRAARRCR